MRKYLNVYLALIRFNFSTMLTYRSNFISSSISSVFYGIFMVISIALLTSKTKFINGWSRDELLLMAGAYSIVITLFHMFFSRNFDRFSQLINIGELDSILLKPLNSQFLISFWLFHFPNSVRLLFGLGFIIYMANRMHLTITVVNLFGFLILLVFSLTLLYAIWFIISTTTIWFTTLSNITEFMYTMTSLTRFPKEVYQELTVYVFAFILPLSLVVATPTKALIGKVLGGDIWLLLGFSVGLFALSRVFWRFALRFYTSAN